MHDAISCMMQYHGLWGLERDLGGPGHDGRGGMAEQVGHEGKNK